MNRVLKELAFIGAAIVCFFGGYAHGQISPTANSLLPSQVGQGGKFLTTNGTVTSWGTLSGTPAGANTQVQFNNAGAFGASAGLTWSGTALSSTAFNLTGTTGSGIMSFLDQGGFQAAPPAGQVNIYGVATAGNLTRLVSSFSSGLNLAFFRDSAATVRNTSGSTITKGSVVFYSGSNGQVPTITLSQSNAASTSLAHGIVVADIADNSFGVIQTAGNFQGVNTGSFSQGDTLYVSSATPGGVTNVQPTAPNFGVRIGTVITSNANGTVTISPQPFVPSTGYIFSTIFNAGTGFRVSGGATSGNVLRGNGTNFVSAQLAAADLSNGVTGSGSVALATSPSFTTPSLGAATATSINKVAITAPATAATLSIANNKTLTVNNSLTLAGTDSTTMTFPTTSATIARTDAAQTFTGAQTFSGGIVGTATNDSAAAGNVGEFISSTISSASSISLTSATPVDITSISLTAGDWDVTAVIAFTPAGSANVTLYSGGISTTSATLPTMPERFQSSTAGEVPSTDSAFPISPARFRLASTTTIFLVSRADFTVGTMKGYGRISARRMR